MDKITSAAVPYFYIIFIFNPFSRAGPVPAWIKRAIAEKAVQDAVIGKLMAGIITAVFKSKMGLRELDLLS